MMDGGRDDSFALWVATLHCIFHRYHNIKIPSQTTLVFIISIVTGPSQTTLVFLVSKVTGPRYVLRAPASLTESETLLKRVF